MAGHSRRPPWRSPPPFQNAPRRARACRCRCACVCCSRLVWRPGLPRSLPKRTLADAHNMNSFRHEFDWQNFCGGACWKWIISQELTKSSYYEPSFISNIERFGATLIS
eukprot:6214174-Pleurochrysis_carterae.AAC.2